MTETVYRSRLNAMFLGLSLGCSYTFDFCSRIRTIDLSRSLIQSFRAWETSVYYQFYLRRSRSSRALVFFTPYRPWLLESELAFFELARQSSFVVEKVTEKIMDRVMFEKDRGVKRIISDSLMNKS